MLKVEVITDEYNRTIYYRNEYDEAVRVLVLSLKGEIIQDSISEYSRDGYLLNDIVYAGDFTTIIGYREFHYDTDRQCRGYSDFKLIDGQLQKISTIKSTWLEKDKKSRCDYYNNQDEWVCYEIFEYEEGFGMITQGFFDDKDEPYEFLGFPSYSDF